MRSFNGRGERLPIDRVTKKYFEISLNISKIAQKSWIYSLTIIQLPTIILDIKMGVS